MRSKTEEFLNLLLWSAEQLCRPTFRNLTESYESWAYRNGLLRQTLRLERKGLIEHDPSSPKDRLYRLTAQGRLQILGGRDPQERWARSWDEVWRIVVFDVPRTRDTERAHLRRYLRHKNFGYLQDSVWITPDSLQEQRAILSGGKVNVASLVLLEARTCAGESDAEIVRGAWNFEQINHGYAEHMRILEQHPGGLLRSHAKSNALLRWAAAENDAWLQAVTIDPLLPAQLLPIGYLGRESWRRRVAILGEARRQLETFECSW